MSAFLLFASADETGAQVSKAAHWEASTMLVKATLAYE
jgi:hypothetical protein